MKQRLFHVKFFQKSRNLTQIFSFFYKDNQNYSFDLNFSTKQVSTASSLTELDAYIIIMRPKCNFKFLAPRLGLCLSFIVYTLWMFRESVNSYLHKTGKNNFELLTNDAALLMDVDEGDMVPSIRKSYQQIFFLETSCAERPHCPARLSARQICGIESVARLHPNHLVYVLIVNSDGFQLKEKTDLLQNVFQYDNVYLRKVNLTKYAQNTPLEQFFAKKLYLKSNYMNTHLSDILRFLTLWKYGGLYLDTDIVCLKSFRALGMNYVAAESPDSIGSSVIQFGDDKLGRLMAEQCLEELNATFDGTKWAHNGPGVLTRVISRLCGTKLTDFMTQEACSGFQVLPIEAFAPVSFDYTELFFKHGYTEDVMSLIKKAYIVHIFNHLNKGIPVLKTSNVAYARLAKQYCPDMFNSSSTYF